MNASAGALLLIGFFLVSLLAGFLWVQWRRETARRVETEIELSLMRRENVTRLPARPSDSARCSASRSTPFPARCW